MELVIILGGVLLLLATPYMVMASRRKAIAAALPFGRQLVGLDGLAGIACVDAAQSIVVRKHGNAQNLIITWDKISSCDIIEESGGQQTQSVASARRSGVLGRAVVGKLLGGNAGEVVGGLTGRTNTRSRCLTEEQVSRILCQIRFADVGLPEVSIRLYTDPYGRKVAKSSRTYQNAMDTARSWHALMEAVIAQSAGSGPPQVQATGTPLDRPTFPVPDEMRNSASAKCKQCGSDVAKNAATCPRCGARRRTSLGVRVIAGLAVILVGRCAVVSVRDRWERDREATRAAAAARQAAAPVQQVQQARLDTSRTEETSVDRAAVMSACKRILGAMNHQMTECRVAELADKTKADEFRRHAADFVRQTLDSHCEKTARNVRSFDDNAVSPCIAAIGRLKCSSHRMPDACAKVIVEIDASEDNQLAQTAATPQAASPADRRAAEREDKARQTEERKRLRARHFVSISPDALAFKLKSAWPDWEQVFETKYKDNYVRWRGKYERKGMMLVEFIANGGRLSAFSCKDFDPAQEGGSFWAAKWEDIVVEGRLDAAHDQLDKAFKTEFVLTECIARMAHQ
jgi:hypothetical protein